MMQSPEALYERERVFNRTDPAAPPRLGVCFSGGGNRSAAFCIGVLRGLHELKLLPRVDIMSAVSGGSYALSWFLLQPFYHRDSRGDPKAALGRIHDEMFDLDGPFQRHLAEHATPFGASSRMWSYVHALPALLINAGFMNALRMVFRPLLTGKGAALRADLLNSMSLARDEYRAGLQRTYQVFPDPARQTPFRSLTISEQALAASLQLRLTDVPPVSFPLLRDFAQRAGLPGFVFNATVNPPAPDVASPLAQRIFELGATGFGSDSCGYMAWEDTDGLGWEPGAEGPPRDPSPFATLRNVNIACAISGAALSGTNIERGSTRSLVQGLNLGLEYAVPSPSARDRAVRLSDGGHSENLGAYALLRRRCRTILVVDAEEDPGYSFESYGKLKQAARRELGIEIAVPGIDSCVNAPGGFSSDTPIHTGAATGSGFRSRLVYVKLCMDASWLGDQAEEICPYKEKHAEFPQESTNDQYFDEPRFSAYRALGYAIGRTLSPDIANP